MRTLSNRATNVVRSEVNISWRCRLAMDPAFANLPSHVPKSVRSVKSVGKSPPDQAGAAVVDEEGYTVMKYVERKDGSTMPRRPDGRQCRTCKMRDSDWCPVAFSQRMKRHVDWERAPLADGTTDGIRCAPHISDAEELSSGIQREWLYTFSHCHHFVFNHTQTLRL